ncbi:MAG: TonB family protein, partial [Sulfurovaceae bacterium]|nr:TonB family protein [Sulfurovaceae bacterium]
IEEPYIEPIIENTPIPIQEKVITRPNPIKRVTSQIVTQSKENLNSKKRNFLRNIREKIYANKRYPALAKRRHIQGQVHVVFDILANGEVTNIQIDEASRILRKEVRRSIRKSFPIDIPSSIASMFPIRNISVNIDFRLQ